MKTNEALSWIFIVLLSIVFQVVVLDNVKLYGYINPHIVPGLLMMCKLLFNRYLHLFMSFVAGLAIDIWNSTGGLYASSLAMISFLPLQNVLGFAVVNDYKTIRSETMEIQRFLLYITLSYLVFFTWLYLIDNFGFKNFNVILLKILYSSAVSVALIVLSDIILSNSAKAKKSR